MKEKKKRDWKSIIGITVLISFPSKKTAKDIEFFRLAVWS